MESKLEISEFQNLLDEVRKHVEHLSASITKRFGAMNLGDLAGFSHLENKHSDIIRFLVCPTCDHKHPEYGDLFISMLRDAGLDVRGAHVLRARREVATSKNRRIDILIETEQDVIVVENKIYALDLTSQVSDYLAFVRREFVGKNVCAAYLTLNGSPVSHLSLTSGEAEAMKDDGRLVFLSYRTDIVGWLRSLNTNSTQEETLRSALIQYTDSVVGLCKIREKDMLAKHELVDHFLNKYQGESFDAIRDVYGSAQLLSDSMSSVYLVRVLVEIRDSLVKRGLPAFLTFEQKRYERTIEWIETVATNGSHLGVEVPVGADGTAEHGLAIEFSDTTQQTKLTFGVMGKGNANTENGRFVERLSEDWPDFKIGSNSWWWAFTSNLRWAVSALMQVELDGRWQNHQGEGIIDHIVNNWFDRELIENLGSIEVE